MPSLLPEIARTWPADLERRIQEAPDFHRGPRTWRKPPQEVQKIIALAAARHGVYVADVVDKCNEKAFVSARREAAHKMRRLGLSYPAIGRYLGGRHHTTIMHLLRDPQANLSHIDLNQPDTSGEWAI